MDKIDEVLTRGVDTIYPTREALEKVLRSGKKLRLYQGFDPTSPQLHIGHSVGLRKMRQFQDLGHHVIFLIGDFTGMIGDPSGKYSERKVLTREQVLENAKSYKEQAGKILRFDGENPVEIKFNSTWLAKMSAIEFFQLSHNLTYAQVVERDMFQERMKKGQDVFMNEFLYPFMQGYDSVAMDVDMEIGGSDQMFNMMMGRKLMHNILKKEKFVLTTPLLTDSQGNKIGKTEGNAIGLTDPPNEFFAKIMSLSDDSIIPCFTLLTDVPINDIKTMEQQIKTGATNPMTFKLQLAHHLTEWLNSKDAADAAQQDFGNRFQKGELTEAKLPTISESKLFKASSLLDKIVMSGIAESNSDARRLINQKAVRINEKLIESPKAVVQLKSGDIIHAGKKAVKII
jgi:tyrosyl-tRNA synthetase